MRRPLFIAAFALAAVLAVTPVSAAQRSSLAAPPQPHFWLTVLHNNDGESRLINAGDGPLADYGGIALQDARRSAQVRGDGWA